MAMSGSSMKGLLGGLLEGVDTHVQQTIKENRERAEKDFAIKRENLGHIIQSMQDNPYGPYDPQYLTEAIGDYYSLAESPKKKVRSLNFEEPKLNFLRKLISGEIEMNSQPGGMDRVVNEANSLGLPVTPPEPNGVAPETPTQRTKAEQRIADAAGNAAQVMRGINPPPQITGPQPGMQLTEPPHPGPNVHLQNARTVTQSGSGSPPLSLEQSARSRQPYPRRQPDPGALQSPYDFQPHQFRGTSLANIVPGSGLLSPHITTSEPTGWVGPDSLRYQQDGLAETGPVREHRLHAVPGLPQGEEPPESLVPSSRPSVPLGPPLSPEIQVAASQAAAQYPDVPIDMIRAVIQAESSGDPNAVSPAGAQGLMQLMPDTARDMGVDDPFDIRENILGGVKYLSRLFDKYGDWNKVLAAYNAGPGRVDRYGADVPFPETQNYVSKVKRFMGRPSGSSIIVPFEEQAGLQAELQTERLRLTASSLKTLADQFPSVPYSILSAMAGIPVGGQGSHIDTEKGEIWGDPGDETKSGVFYTDINGRRLDHNFDPTTIPPGWQLLDTVMSRNRARRAGRPMRLGDGSLVMWHSDTQSYSPLPPGASIPGVESPVTTENQQPQQAQMKAVADSIIGSAGERLEGADEQMNETMLGMQFADMEREPLQDTDGVTYTPRNLYTSARIADEAITQWDTLRQNASLGVFDPWLEQRYPNEKDGIRNLFLGQAPRPNWNTNPMSEEGFGWMRDENIRKRVTTLANYVRSMQGFSDTPLPMVGSRSEANVNRGGSPSGGSPPPSEEQVRSLMENSEVAEYLNSLIKRGIDEGLLDGTFEEWLSPEGVLQLVQTEMLDIEKLESLAAPSRRNLSFNLGTPGVSTPLNLDSMLMNT